MSTKSVMERYNIRELTQSCQEVSEYPSTSIKVLASECHGHTVIAGQDRRCQDSSEERDEHIHAIHEQGVMEKMFS